MLSKGIVLCCSRASSPQGKQEKYTTRKAASVIKGISFVRVSLVEGGRFLQVSRLRVVG